jgi:hypothetical protein
LRPGLSTSKTFACAGLHNPGNPAPVDIAPGAGDAMERRAPCSPTASCLDVSRSAHRSWPAPFWMQAITVDGLRAVQEPLPCPRQRGLHTPVDAVEIGEQRAARGLVDRLLVQRQGWILHQGQPPRLCDGCSGRLRLGEFNQLSGTARRCGLTATVPGPPSASAQAAGRGARTVGRKGERRRRGRSPGVRSRMASRPAR